MEEFFDQLGQELVAVSCEGRLERAFRSLGGNIIDFLTTLNSVHDVFMLDNESDNDGDVQSVNGVVSEEGSDNDDILDSDQAGFMCTQLLPEDNAIELNFTAENPAVAYLLVGILKGIAERLYATTLQVELYTPDGIHFRYESKMVRYDLSVGQN